MTRVTATVITFNEAAHIRAALASLAFADEIIVVDSQSTDDTVQIAREFTDRVFVRAWPGYVAQKNFAAEQASHDWIFSLDADERVSAPLADEIRGVMAQGSPGLKSRRSGTVADDTVADDTVADDTVADDAVADDAMAGGAVAGYRVPRVTFHLGRWLRSTDWYPDHQLRLYDRRRARWAGRLVHESVAVDGAIAYLSSEILHYAYRDVSHHWQSMDRYTTLAARQLFEDGRRAGWWDLALHPAAAFLRNYLLRGGFRDGIPGLIVSAMNARYVGLKFAKLWELCSASTSTPPEPGAADSSKRS